MTIKTIIQQAKKDGICNEWHQQMLQNPSIENLCKMFFKGDDWAIENNFPSVEMLEQFKGKTEPYGLFLDHTGKVESKDSLAFFGNSDVSVEYGGFSASKLILRQNSKAKILAKDYAFLIVKVLDNAELEVEKLDNAKVKIIR